MDSKLLTFIRAITADNSKTNSVMVESYPILGLVLPVTFSEIGFSVPDIENNLISKWNMVYAESHDIETAVSKSTTVVDKKQKSSHNVSQWMSVNCYLYPRILYMSREFLDARSTFVSSKSAFSNASIIVHKRSAQLGNALFKIYVNYNLYY
ncbi:hypothetical protein BB558_006718 [Smittium angustum]|uniref:Uncharacterized protein n=1 Tax=Smittium angustum TaxID=133377 RepID=A0A2U1IX13_SMIAN|nr:hypothetical protein BB558_006718 [Smittium angustum]